MDASMVTIDCMKWYPKGDSKGVERYCTRTPSIPNCTRASVSGTRPGRSSATRYALLIVFSAKSWDATVDLQTRRWLWPHRDVDQEAREALATDPSTPSFSRKKQTYSGVSGRQCLTNTPFGPPRLNSVWFSFKPWFTASVS